MRAGASVWRGRSRCNACRHTLAWYDLVPLMSFLLLRGKCRYCHARIDIQYPAVEFAAGLLFVLAYLSVPYAKFYILDSIFPILVSWYFISVLIVIFVYDLRYMLIPDRVTIPAIVIGIIAQIINATSYQLPVPTTSRILGEAGTASFLAYQLGVPILVGGGFFLMQYLISRGRWIGGGDIRLGALMGVMLGWPGILAGLMLAYVVGSLVAIPLVMLGKKGMQSQLPFGTFLSGATVLVMLWEDEIIKWYTSFLQ